MLAVMKGRLNRLAIGNSASYWSLVAGLLLSVVGCERTDPDNAYMLPEVRWVASATAEEEPVPDFSSFADVTEKKQAFFNFMRQRIILENERIGTLQDAIAYLQEAAELRALTPQELEWLKSVSHFYKVSTDDPAVMFKAFVIKIQPVPESLALAQSAIESAWGTSRFAKQGNNYFGQWCFVEGCGLVPAGRAEGKTHEVAAFKSARHSVEAYILNINSHQAFSELRELRLQLLDDGLPITGVALAEGLRRYSEEGEHYVHKVQSLIRSNGLELAASQ